MISAYEGAPSALGGSWDTSKTAAETVAAGWWYLPDVPLRVLRSPGRSPAVIRHGGRPSPLHVTHYRDLFYVPVQDRDPVQDLDSG
jgi:hypothetical protein